MTGYDTSETNRYGKKQDDSGNVRRIVDGDHLHVAVYTGLRRLIYVIVSSAKRLYKKLFES